MYCEYWRNKLKKKPIEFPKKLSSAIAGITEDFSFAYLKEAFVATLLELARKHTGDEDDGCDDREDDDDSLDKYEFWRIMKEQVETLRSQMSNGQHAGGSRMDSTGKICEAYSPDDEELRPLLESATLRSTSHARKSSTLTAEARPRQALASAVLGEAAAYRRLDATNRAFAREGVFGWGL